MIERAVRMVLESQDQYESHPAVQYQAAIDATDEHLSAFDILGRPLLFMLLGVPLTKHLFPRRKDS